MHYLYAAYTSSCEPEIQSLMPVGMGYMGNKEREKTPEPEKGMERMREGTDQFLR